MKKYILGLILLVILFPLVSFASFDVSLKYGSKGEAVKELQDFLVGGGFLKGLVDGKFGFATLKAVKAFQTANKLSPDGYWGKLSRAKASTILADELKTSDKAEQAEIAPKVIQPVVQPVTTIIEPVVPVSNIVNNTPSAITQNVANQASPVIIKPVPTCTIQKDTNNYIKWTSTNATSGSLQSADGISGGVPMWRSVWDMSKDWTNNGISQNSTVSSGSFMPISSSFVRIIVEGAGGTTICELK